MKKLKFLMAVHCHQPVGNFDRVFEEAFAKAYLPFIETLERHPRIRIALHYSGSLIDWLEVNRPEFIRRIGELLKRNQLEILSCGYYEPILAILPEEDKVGQIRLLNEKINRMWGTRAKGAWLTERVWEPGLTTVFREAEIDYTIVDDTHFEKAGKKAEDLQGYYITEEAGKTLNIFPGSKFLRYALPFKMPEETIRYFRDFLNSGKEAITFADDGEKFGLWPHTYKWVYEEKWLENFFKAVEDNLDWIEMVNFRQYIDDYPASGRIYLPCASYAEMLEWSDGYFRNFLVRYPEANRMHKRMLEVSNRLQVTGYKLQATSLNEARRYLYMAQCNDSYWHGVFGGLYLNHLRYSVYSNLNKAEKIIDAISHADTDWLESRLTDFDCDGNEELIMENSRLKAYIDLDEQAGVFELDYKEKSINLTNTLARRKEKYHDKIKEKMLKKSCVAQQEATSPLRPRSEASIHDLEKNIPDDWKKILFYDRYQKACLREYFFKDINIGMDDFSRSVFEESDSPDKKYKTVSMQKDAHRIIALLGRDFSLNGLPFAIEKFFELRADSAKIHFRYAITNKSKNFWKGRFGVEFIFSLWDEILATKGERGGVGNLLIKDSWFGLKIDLKLDRAADLWHFPIETVYESESGFEKNFQGLNLLFSWETNFVPNEVWETSGSMEIGCYL